MVDWLHALAGAALAWAVPQHDCISTSLQGRQSLMPAETATPGEFSYWKELTASIALANDILGPDRKIELAASWDNTKEKPPEDGRIIISVFLVETPGGVSGRSVLRRTFDGARQAFWKHLEEVKVNQSSDSCKDIDDCVVDLYDAPTASITANLINRMASIDAAKIEASCPVVIFQDLDLEAFYRFLDVGDDKVDTISQRYMFTPLLLHEVGHHSDFRIESLPFWQENYYSVLAMSNNRQKEELRADAFAAYSIALGCKPNGRSFDWDRKEACMAVLLQWGSYYRYMLFNRSRAGLCRLYLPFSDRHPNILLRTLLQGAIVSDELSGGQKRWFREQIASHLHTREELYKKPWMTTEKACRASFIQKTTSE